MIDLPGAAPALADREFRAVREIVYRDAGIQLGDAKKALVVSRLLRRLRELGLAGFRPYLALVESDAAERRTMLEAICTHETSFFREPQHFAFLEREVYPQLLRDAAAGRRSRHVRALSAGCSSGEEAFSVAMSLAQHLEGFTTEVIAGDVSARILARAAEARWPIERAAQIPPALLKTWMLRGVGGSESWMRASSELRARVRFVPLNLNDGAHPELPVFDFVFCRNVLIYFDAVSRERALRGLMPHLAPSGLLFLGHSESLGQTQLPLLPQIPTVYRRA